ncbi:MAG: Gfo/Idh/MocA family protein [Christensenellales bacterium]|jgi:predicted dehydrogenase
MVKTGVIGIGRMGSVHAFNIRHKLAGSLRLTAVCDIDEKKLEKYKNGDIAAFTDYKEMIEKCNLDAVIIATPHYSHAKIAKYAIEHGVHTLVEKPLAADIEDAYSAVSASEKVKDTVFAIMFNQRTNNIYKKAKRIIDSGQIGKIKRANWIITNWYRSQSYYNQSGWRASWSGEGGGVLINQCVHQLDLLQWLLGMPKYVSAKCKTVGRDIKTENDVTAILEYEQGFEAVFIASTHDLPGTNRLEISGEGGRLIIEKSELIFDKLKVSEPEVSRRAKGGLYGTTKISRKKYGYGLIKRIVDTILGQQRNVLANFAAVIEKGEPCVAKGSEGLASLMLINGIYLSDWLQKKIELPIDGKLYSRQLELHKEKK